MCGFAPQNPGQSARVKRKFPLRIRVLSAFRGSAKHSPEVWIVRFDTTFLRRCIETLEYSLEEIGKHRDTDDFLYDVFRAACVKEFELVLEQSGKLLRKRLADFFASSLQADRLAFRDLFRHAAKHGVLELDAVERWLAYRDNRSDTAHNYGEDFAEATLKLLPAFVVDARALVDTIEATRDD